MIHRKHDGEGEKRSLGSLSLESLGPESLALGVAGGARREESSVHR